MLWINRNRVSHSRKIKFLNHFVCLSLNEFQKEFIKTSKLHCYNTRQSYDLGFSLPSFSTNFKKTF